MVRLFFKKLGMERLREDIKHIHYYFSINHVHETYLITIIRQKFQLWKFIKVWLPVSMTMFRMPMSSDQIVIDATHPKFHELSLPKIRQDYKEHLKESFHQEIKGIEDSKLPDEEKIGIIKVLKDRREKMLGIWQEADSEDKRLLRTFTLGNHEYLCKEVEGVTTYYFMIKRLEGMNILTKIEVIKAGSNIHVMKTQQFNVTPFYAKKFSNSILGKEIRK